MTYLEECHNRWKEAHDRLWNSPPPPELPSNRRTVRVAAVNAKEPEPEISKPRHVPRSAWEPEEIARIKSLVARHKTY